MRFLISILCFLSPAYSQVLSLQTEYGTIITLNPPPLQKSEARPKGGPSSFIWFGTPAGVVTTLVINELPVRTCNAVVLLRARLLDLSGLPNTEVKELPNNTRVKAGGTIILPALNLSYSERFQCLTPSLAVQSTIHMGTLFVRGGDQPFSERDYALVVDQMTKAWNSVSVVPAK